MDATALARVSLISIMVVRICDHELMILWRDTETGLRYAR